MALRLQGLETPDLEDSVLMQSTITSMRRVPVVEGMREFLSVMAANERYWQKLGRETLHKSLHLPRITTAAKNIILFLGDGMGIPTVTATRIYKGQKAGKKGEEESLTFDQFPYVSLSKTFALDKQNPDSANTATAYLCGVKTNYGTIGVNGRVILSDCNASKDKKTHLPSILQWAQEAGKSTGFVTSTRVTHATPAGLYAHVANRDWEASSPDKECPDIAMQLVHHLPGKNINVILGGGQGVFISTNMTDSKGMAGKRIDSRDLISEWLKDKESRGLNAKAVFDLDSFLKVDAEKEDYLLGLFHSSHLPYVADRPESAVLPNLVQLTEMAIRILSKNQKGFFLMVEGGRIDSAHHMNWAMKALEEGLEFDKAIGSAIKMIDVTDTLIVVTADHSHTFTIAGDYPERGSNILGLGGTSDINNLTMTILTYANGPGYKGERKSNLSEEEIVNKDYRQETTYPLSMETHGSEDVAVYAKGPMSHLFHGVHDQSHIPYVMAYASCIGPDKRLCSGAIKIFSCYPLFLGLMSLLLQMWFQNSF